MIYLIHLSAPLGHAKHYLGFVEDRFDLERRLKRHRSGQGSRLLRACNERGIAYEIVRVWPAGTRTHERRMKNRASTQLCPTCVPNPYPFKDAGESENRG